MWVKDNLEEGDRSGALATLLNALKETQKAGIDTEAVDKLKKQIKDSKKIMNIKEELNPISQIKDEITNTIKRS
jgi:hypothetical protein